MHTTYIPKVQLFIRFALRWTVFEEIEIFEFPIGYNVKIKLLINLNELKISKFQKKKKKENFYGEHYQETVARAWMQKP